MRADNYRKMPLDELKKRAKSAQLNTYLLTGIIIVQTIVGVFLLFTDGFSVFTIMPVVFIPILIISFKNLKMIKDQIASRDT